MEKRVHPTAVALCFSSSVASSNMTTYLSGDLPFLLLSSEESLERSHMTVLTSACSMMKPAALAPSCTVMPIT